MWKLFWTAALIALVVSQDVKDNAINQETKEVANNSSAIASIPKQIANETATLVGKVEEIKAEKPVESATVKVNEEADPGTKEHPFDPEKLATIPGESSIGSMKYYFVLLVVSSLSVISIIIFKALR